jgi:hypothetical protein
VTIDPERSDLVAEFDANPGGPHNHKVKADLSGGAL